MLPSYRLFIVLSLIYNNPPLLSERLKGKLNLLKAFDVDVKQLVDLYKLVEKCYTNVVDKRLE